MPTRELSAGAVAARSLTLERYLRRFTGHAQDLEDLIQEVWLTRVRRRAHTWTHRDLIDVARSRARTLQRQNARRRASELAFVRRERAPAADDEAEQREQLRLIVECLFALAEPYRTALRLRYLEGLAVKHVAACLGLPGGTVRSRIHRGREQLRSLLRKRCDDLR